MSTENQKSSRNEILAKLPEINPKFQSLLSKVMAGLRVLVRVQELNEGMKRMEGQDNMDKLSYLEGPCLAETEEMVDQLQRGWME